MIPSIFEAKAQGHDDWSRDEKAAWSRSMSGALIGFAGAIGALGGVFINVVLRASYVGEAKSATNAFWVFLAFYVICAVVTWVVFLRMQTAQDAGQANSSARFPRPRVDRPMTVTRTACSYCGVGCGIEVTTTTDCDPAARHREGLRRQAAPGQLRPAVHQGCDACRDDGRRRRAAEVGAAAAISG